MGTPRVAVDFGSTSIKAVDYSPGGTVRKTASIPFPAETAENRVTHDPEQVLQAIQTIPGKLGIDGPWEVALTGQRSTFILWDRETGEAATPLISWRDRRGEDWIDRLSDNHFRQIQETTGLRPEAGYPLSKLCMVLEENERRRRAENGQLLYGPVDTWLIWNLSEGERWSIDPTQASRTLLYDIGENVWAEQLLQQFSIPATMLPQIQPRLDPPVEAKTIWPQATIMHTIGDQPASTLGGQPPPFDQTRVTLGTGGFVAAPCEPSEQPPGLNLSFTPELNPEKRIFQAEGVVLSAGRAVDWLQDLLDVDWETIGQWLRPPLEEDIPLWCPALSGVGAPFWSNRPAALTEFTEDTDNKELMVGMITSVLLRIRDILHQLPRPKNTVRLDGGLAKLPGLPRLAAAIWERPIRKTVTSHLTARGALVASHGSHPYFDVEPWSTLETTPVEPAENLPVTIWQQRWDAVLHEWGLEIPQ